MLRSGRHKWPSLIKKDSPRLAANGCVRGLESRNHWQTFNKCTCPIQDFDILKLSTSKALYYFFFFFPCLFLLFFFIGFVYFVYYVYSLFRWINFHFEIFRKRFRIFLLVLERGQEVIFFPPFESYFFEVVDHLKEIVRRIIAL